MQPRHVTDEFGLSVLEKVLAWVVLALSLILLLALDITILHAPLSAGRISFQTATKLTTIWFSIGLTFDIFVYGYMGGQASMDYLAGYFLEYLLSFDNLFVFHLVFQRYCTPDTLIYRALYFGIGGAIVLRVFLFFVGSGFFSLGLDIVKFAFGALLIWSGVKSARELDDEDNIEDGRDWILSWVRRHLPVSEQYEEHGRFFITEPEETEYPEPRMNSLAHDQNSQMDASMGKLGSGILPRLESFEGSGLLDPNKGPVGRQVSAASSNAEMPRNPKLKHKASQLLLVVITILAVDVIFAVDAVTSKIATVNSVFLNCSSSAFAMLSLRSLYFVMESLIHSFRMLKYGIAAILILLGLKLIFSRWLSLSHGVCFAVFAAICASSIAASYWLPQIQEEGAELEIGEGAHKGSTLRGVSANRMQDGTTTIAANSDSIDEETEAAE